MHPLYIVKATPVPTNKSVEDFPADQSEGLKLFERSSLDSAERVTHIDEEDTSYYCTADHCLDIPGTH